jgi:hypothetical protein
MKLKNKTLRNRSKLFSIPATVALTVLLSGIAPPVHSDTDDSEILLKSALTGMDYFGISIEPCRISFAREMTPNKEQWIIQIYQIN